MFILVLGNIKYFYFCLNHPLKTYDYIYCLFMFILVPGIIDYFFFTSNNPFKTHNYRILILGFIEYFCYHLNNLFKIDDYNQFFFSFSFQRVFFFYSKYPFNTDYKQFIFRFSFILRIVLLLLFKSFTEDLYYNKFIFQVHQVSEYFFFYLNHPFTIHDYNQSISGFILALGIIQYFSICSNNLLKKHDYNKSGCFLYQSQQSSFAFIQIIHSRTMNYFTVVLIINLF